MKGDQTASAVATTASSGERKCLIFR